MSKKMSPYGIAAFTAYLLTQPLSSVYAADAQVFREDLVKAGFVYNFTKFTEWSGDRDMRKATKIDICIIGDSPLNNASSIFKKASSERLQFSLVNEPSWRNAIKHCHIVVVSNDQEDNLPEMLLGFKHEPVLTVSEIANFAEMGGIIQFLTQGDTIKLIINEKAAREAGLRIDAQLLEIASKVIGK